MLPYNKKAVQNNKIYAGWLLLQTLDTLEGNSLSNICKERKTELWIEKELVCLFLIQDLKIPGLGLKVLSEIQKALDTIDRSQILSDILDTQRNGTNTQDASPAPGRCPKVSETCEQAGQFHS